jgi:hypothetical protein
MLIVVTWIHLTATGPIDICGPVRAVLQVRAETKSEYLRGEMFAMSGASREHNLIAANVSAELRQQLRERPCEVYQADMRVKVSSTGLYTSLRGRSTGCINSTHSWATSQHLYGKSTTGFARRPGFIDRTAKKSTAEYLPRAWWWPIVSRTPA